MGISRDSAHKRRRTGGRNIAIRKKRKFELGRPSAMTKIGDKRITRLRVRGGNFKFRALRLESGNFTWASESKTTKSRILVVNYHASSNELVRTNTLVKGAVVQIDAHPFRQWYQQYYNVNLGKKEEDSPEKTETGEKKEISNRKTREFKKRQKERPVPDAIKNQIKTGRLLAKISSRPGQCGRADGYILEGEELAFYQKKIEERKKKS